MKRLPPDFPPAQPGGWDHRHAHGPFDIIGDVHGCAAELEMLLALLGYARAAETRTVRRPRAIVEAGIDAGRDASPLTLPPPWRHPAARTAIFVGDLVNRGPRIVDTLALVMSMTAAGSARCVAGNHDVNVMRYMQWRDVTGARRLERSILELARQTPEAREAIRHFLEGLPSHLVLDEGQLVVAHAGLREDLQARDSAEVRRVAAYGEQTGEKDALGLPVRDRWVDAYRGAAAVVYGHTPVSAPVWRNGTIDIDTGCVYGGRLTALRWPERELISVPALETYASSKRPFLRRDPKR